jgi:phosphohistidine phosphatase SixA
MRYLYLVFLCLPNMLHANDWEALRQPGAIAIMRHALAPGTSDPAAFQIDDCSTQRNLDDRGRAQARRTGEALRGNGFEFEAVFTSQWCRTRDTARLLALGTPIDAPPLYSFFGRYEREKEQTLDTIALLDSTTGLRILVTHQVNISALIGRTTRSGEIIVFRKTETGTEILGSILVAP